MLAKFMFYHSASCYSRLREAGLNLPSESTVRNWVSDYSIEPGYDDTLLSLIKNALSKLPKSERLCALKWDEMSIKAWEEYSKEYDMIEGLVDMGFLGRRPERTKQVLLLCLDSINLENTWGQIFAYFFTGKGATGDEISKIVKEGLKHAKNVGAIVKIVACDQGTANQKAFNEHFSVTLDKPFFMYEDAKYYASFD